MRSTAWKTPAAGGAAKGSAHEFIAGSASHARVRRGLGLGLVALYVAHDQVDGPVGESTNSSYGGFANMYDWFLAS